MKKRNARICLWDIETSKSIVKTFGIWNVNINPNDIIQDFYIMCGAYKWLGEKEIHTVSCTSKQLRAGNDKKVVKELCRVIRKADLIIAHNGDKFDLKKLRARVIKHGLPQINNVKTIDTLKSARREFGFTSNRLDYIGKFLGLGGKIGNAPGLWDMTMDGDMEALGRMVKYNKRDIELLEKVYLKMRPHISNHPDLNVFEKDLKILNPCPNCTSTKTIKFGRRHAMKVKKVYQRYMCNSCGCGFLGSKPLN